MGPVTLTRMGRKRTKADATAGDQKKTGIVRVDADLVRKLSIISTATGQEVKDIVSPVLRPHIERLYADVVKQLGQDVAKE